MELHLNIDAVKINFIYFIETRPNVLFNGTFTKINYCNDFFTMYGLHIYINNFNLESIARLESSVLDAYAEHVGHSVFKSAKLVNDTKLSSNMQIKISGVWENDNNEIGLSYKIKGPL